jgi:uncharacterized protein with GYD domain
VEPPGAALWRGMRAAWRNVDARQTRDAVAIPMRRRIVMAMYVVLGRFSDQGIRAVKETTKRADAAKEAAKAMGVTIKEIYWTIGQYDLVLLAEAADDAAMTAFGLNTGKAGNVRTETLRAFTQAEIGAILNKVD